ncbi:MAG: MBL fold metallo-hydrolase [Vicinamibacteria bacterium]
MATSRPWVSGVLCLSAALGVSLGLASPEPPAVRAVVLGIAQDGGVPHIGCRQDLCVAARRDPARRQRVASIGLVDGDARFLIDATPDLPSQIESLWGSAAPPDRRRPLSGILLTHAHAGHYAGLLSLGREALGADHVPVYATPRMARFLRENAPWSELVARGHVDLRELAPGVERALTPRLHVTPVLVPHRDELSDTVGFVVRGPARRILYVPDIDKWQRWDRRLADEVRAVDAALVDGTFLDAAEIPGRSQADIPHPLVGETAALLPDDLRARVRLIHLNHTNRLLWAPEALAEPALRGLAVARDGEELPL